MMFALSGWMLYTMLAIFGLMAIDFLLSFFNALKSNSVSPQLGLNLLTNILNSVFPLMLLVNMMKLDPTGWVLMIMYYIGGISVIWSLLNSIKSKF